MCAIVRSPKLKIEKKIEFKHRANRNHNNNHMKIFHLSVAQLFVVHNISYVCESIVNNL